MDCSCYTKLEVGNICVLRRNTELFAVTGEVSIRSSLGANLNDYMQGEENAHKVHIDHGWDHYSIWNG